MSSQTRGELFLQGYSIVEILEDAETGEAKISPINVSGLRSRIALLGPIYVYRKHGDSFELAPGRVSEETAKTLYHSRARRHLKQIRRIVYCPIITQDERGKAKILPKGYHSALGGVYVAKGKTPADVTLSPAAEWDRPWI